MYKRYVDDTLVILNDKEEAQKLLDFFNKAHPNLKFTMEMEIDNSLPFLDINLKRRPDGTISRSVHRQSTWSGQYVHFKSFVPIHYKKGLVRTLYETARKICSAENLTEELQFIENILIKQGFPKSFIKKHSRNTPPSMQPCSVQKKRVYLHLPYKGEDVHILIRRRLKQAVDRAYPMANQFVTQSFYILLLLLLLLLTKNLRKLCSGAIPCWCCGRSVRTKSNPADMASRGSLLKEDSLEFWFKRPDFIKGPKDTWPSAFETTNEEVTLEGKKQLK